MGRKNRPSWRICVFDARTKRDGREIEALGWYDNVQNKKQTLTELKLERARYWLSQGAKPSVIVHQIFKRKGVYEAAAAKTP